MNNNGGVEAYLEKKRGNTQRQIPFYLVRGFNTGEVNVVKTGRE
ncbi:hypothetical protein [Salipaludibacillus agaradhaerens]|nr:hypothetical protein [Salipaludibacillus agaradhaerens]